MIKLLKNQYFWLILIIVLAFILRLYKIDNPIADWHSWRQADTAAVTRNFVKEGFNPLYPKGDDMSSIADKPNPQQLPPANPGRFRFVEFPAYNIVAFPFYQFFGVQEKFHRLVTVFLSLGSLIFLYLIVKKYTDTLTALVSAFSFAVMPFNVFFGRVILPEPAVVFFSLGMIYFVDRWIWEHKNIFCFLGWFFAALALLIKPWAIFFALPLIYSAFKKGGNKNRYLSFVFFSILPFILWRFWVLQFPEGIPASSWLLNGDGIRFKPMFWWWIISERLGREILGATGLVLFFIGLLTKPKKNYFLHFWALSSLLFLIVFATGNIRHNYYQIMIVPASCIFLSIGFVQMIRGLNDFVPRFWTIAIAFLFLPLSFYFSWIAVKGFYQVNNPSIVEAGKKTDRILPKDAIVLANYNGDTAFLYQTNRYGWPYLAGSLEDMILKYGITSYISTTKDSQTKDIMAKFKILEENDNFVIVDLTRSK